MNRPTQLFAVALLLGVGLSCKKNVVKPAPQDLLTTALWCDNGVMSYHFQADGRFTMRSTAGKTWSGNWFYYQPFTDVEVDLRYGPDRLIQIIQLQISERTATRLIGTWTDEIAKELPVNWQVCAPVAN